MSRRASLVRGRGEASTGLIRDNSNISVSISASTDKSIEVAAGTIVSIVIPVLVALITTSVAVYCFHTSSSSATLSAGLNAYLVIKPQRSSDSGSPPALLGGIGSAFVDALVMVCAIGTGTFVMVALFYFRCFRCIFGYLILASGLLLGSTGSYLASTALESMQISCDWISFLVVAWNVSVVGVISIFFRSSVGIPLRVQQGYLILTSTIVAWMLSKFPALITWALLSLLAAYDLCAVLSPCGPLKFLISLAQARAQEQQEMRRQEGDSRGPTPHSESTATMNHGTYVRLNHGETVIGARGRTSGERKEEGETERCDDILRPGGHHKETITGSDEVILVRGVAAQSTERCGISESIPARCWSDEYLGDINKNGDENDIISDEGAEVEDDDDDTEPEEEDALLPGLLYSAAPYLYVDSLARHGYASRVDNGAGKVDRSKSSGEEKGIQPGIKLGLGDFIFYSVLVTEAGKTSFISYLCATISIIIGLVGTLVMLSVNRGQALPALPISIALGIAAFCLSSWALLPCLSAAVTGVSPLLTL